MTLATATEFAVMLTAADLQETGWQRRERDSYSRRERELVTLVAQGRTDAQIAGLLFISIRTVRSHLDPVSNQACCRRRAGLTRLVLQGAWSSHPPAGGARRRVGSRTRRSPRPARPGPFLGDRRPGEVETAVRQSRGCRRRRPSLVAPLPAVPWLSPALTPRQRAGRRAGPAGRRRGRDGGGGAGRGDQGRRASAG